MAQHDTKVGLAGLTAIVFGSVIGGAVYNLPQNMAASAGLAGMILAWLVTGIGVLMLVFTFKILNRRKPELNEGIYQYAQEGFGNYVGFNISWGYWWAAAMSNLAYAVLLNDSLGYFFPVLLNHGWEMLLLCSSFIWIMFFIVLMGIREAALLNTVLSIIKFGSLAIIIVVLVIGFSSDIFISDVWARQANLGPIHKQMSSTMFVTLWAFIGVEGAVVISGRARNPRQIGKATIIGFSLAWLLYIFISTMSYGLMPIDKLAGLNTPSLAYVMSIVSPKWGVLFVIVSVIISVIGGWVAWTILMVQMPFSASRLGILPKAFSRENRHESPYFALMFSTVIMQLFIFMVVMAKNVYLATIEIAGVMYLPAYLFCGLYLIKLGLKGEIETDSARQRIGYLIVGWGATIYCLWTFYAGNLVLLLLTSLIYITGLPFYRNARKTNKLAGQPLFTANEKVVLAAIVLASIVSLVILLSGGFELR